MALILGLEKMELTTSSLSLIEIFHGQVSEEQAVFEEYMACY
jgi:hypothetical protein